MSLLLSSVISRAQNNQEPTRSMWKINSANLGGFLEKWYLNYWEKGIVSSEIQVRL